MYEELVRTEVWRKKLESAGFRVVSTAVAMPYGPAPLRDPETGRVRAAVARLTNPPVTTP